MNSKMRLLFSKTHGELFEIQDKTNNFLARVAPVMLELRAAEAVAEGFSWDLNFKLNPLLDFLF